MLNLPPVLQHWLQLRQLQLPTDMCSSVWAAVISDDVVVLHLLRVLQCRLSFGKLQLPTDLLSSVLYSVDITYSWIRDVVRWLPAVLQSRLRDGKLQLPTDVFASVWKPRLRWICSVVQCLPSDV